MTHQHNPFLFPQPSDSFERTIPFGADLVGLELAPRPVGELIGEDGDEEDFEERSSELLVEL